jgi:hypothetical protein
MTALRGAIITERRKDGSIGSALYSTPFALAQAPPSEWAEMSIVNWNRPPRWTTGSCTTQYTRLKFKVLGVAETPGKHLRARLSEGYLEPRTPLAIRLLAGFGGFLLFLL